MLSNFNHNSILFSFLTVGAINFLAAVLPGPDFAVVVKTALNQPRKPAVFTALGIASGLSVHITYCVLGLAIVITHSLIAFDVLKYCGGAYIVYLGVQSLWAKKPLQKGSEFTTHSEKPLTAWQAWQRGFWCNALNPKAGLFFLGLFTLVVKPSTPIGIQVLYGVEMMVITFTWFASLALIITHENVKMKIGGFQYYLSKLMGVLLVGFGIRLIFL